MKPACTKHAEVNPIVVLAKAGTHTPCHLVFAQRGEHLLQKSTPGVMGPRLRGDDPWLMHAPHAFPPEFFRVSAICILA